LKEILIVGGQGFIGSSLAKFYRREGYEVKITTKYYESASADSIQSDYSKDSFLEVFRERNYKKIFFLSGNPYPGLSFNNCNKDIDQTLVPLVNAVEALKDTSFKGDFWFASSVAVYGKADLEVQRETDICNPLSNYAVVKLAGENYLKMMSLTSDLNLGSFRIFSTFGENLKRQLIYDIFTKIKNDPYNISLFGSGMEIRDLSYVGDQVKRIKLVADNIRPKGDIYNLGSGESTSIKSVAEEIVKIMGYGTEINFTSEHRVFDGNSWVACVDKLQKLAPNPKSSLSDSLIKTISSLEKLQ
jgi:nucleoside-diphosphate-sugar epimerase